MQLCTYQSFHWLYIIFTYNYEINYFAKSVKALINWNTLMVRKYLMLNKFDEMRCRTRWNQENDWFLTNLFLIIQLNCATFQIFLFFFLNSFHLIGSFFFVALTLIKPKKAKSCLHCFFSHVNVTFNVTLNTYNKSSTVF